MILLCTRAMGKEGRCCAENRLRQCVITAAAFLFGRMNVKRTQWLFRGIALVLAAVLLSGSLLMKRSLQQRSPGLLSDEIAQILPDSAQPMPGNYEDDPDETQPPVTEPPVTEPPETRPSVTKPSEPAPEKPQQTPPEQPENQGDPLPPENPPVGDAPGGNGDTDEEGQGQPNPDQGPEDDSQLRIVTDLYNGEITYDQLTDDVLPFYAYLINGDGMTLRVKLRNSATPLNGTYLTPEDRNYQAVLQRNETNFFTLYIKDGNTTVHEITYKLRYVAQMADEDHPTVGSNPPTVVTNLEGVEQLNNRNFTLTVKATAYTGKTLYSDHIEVRLDGQRITQPAGGPQYEYQLYFKDPEIGNTVPHTVTVRAWDDEGNSAFYTYRFDYHFIDTGGEIGTAYIILDATTVGLGVLEEPYTYRIKQGVPASYAILEMLEEYGYEYDYAGSPDTGFYLRRISRGGLMDYAGIPEELWEKVLRDELSLTGQTDTDSLGEFDYTQGSGWMYSVGGNVYSGKGLSNYYLNNGETLYLRFTLAYGKDIGGYSSTGGSYGLLSSYCGKWINDDYIDLHNWSDEKVTREPTCTQAGERSCVCSVCGDKKDAVEIPALEHSFREIGAAEPADGKDGIVIYQCEHCAEQKEEVLPWEEETQEE